MDVKWDQVPEVLVSILEVAAVPAEGSKLSSSLTSVFCAGLLCAMYSSQEDAS